MDRPPIDHSSSALLLKEHIRGSDNFNLIYNFHILFWGPQVFTPGISATFPYGGGSQ